MKVSKSYLRQIIKEELETVLLEEGISPEELNEGFFDTLFGTGMKGLEGDMPEKTKMTDGVECSEGEAICKGQVFVKAGKEQLQNDEFALKVISTTGGTEDAVAEVMFLGNGYQGSDKYPFKKDFRENEKLGFVKAKNLLNSSMFTARESGMHQVGVSDQEMEQSED
jgi:hypothetical protein